MLVVRERAQQLPPWVLVPVPTKPLSVSLPNLHRGESDAIALAEELGAPLLPIDDRIGMKVALERGLTITGTLGILVEAAQAGLVHIDHVLVKLKETNFRAVPGLYERWAKTTVFWKARIAKSRPPFNSKIDFSRF